MIGIWFLFQRKLHGGCNDDCETMVKWWKEKPTIHELGRFLCHPVPLAADWIIVQLSNLWDGKEINLDNRDIMYRLEFQKET